MLFSPVFPQILYTSQQIRKKKGERGRKEVKKRREGGKVEGVKTEGKGTEG